MSAMTEQAFLADALTAIRAQQTVIERCSANIARAMQENADAFRELRSSISTLNEMVSSVQAIARVALPGPSGTRGMVPVVEIPTRGRRVRKGSEAGMTPEPRSRRGVQPGSGLGSGSSRDAVSTAVRARRSETPIVQARKKRKLVDLGFERPLFPPTYFADRVPAFDPDDIADLASDVESLPPPSDFDEDDLHGPDAEEGGEVEREPSEPVRGRDDLVEPEILPESARERSEVKWPRKGPNTLKGRLVACDMCEAVFHWACGGFDDTDEVADQVWSCPECEDKVKQRRHREIEVAQKERCNRPDCIMRAYKSIRKQNDDQEFVFERIIGRKMVKRDNKSRRIYRYLVLWEGYPVYDCTWEKAKNIPSTAKYEAEFLAECDKEGLNTNRVVMLKEATDSGWWSDKGLRRRGRLVREGVMPAEWWEKDDEDDDEDEVL